MIHTYHPYILKVTNISAWGGQFFWGEENVVAKHPKPTANIKVTHVLKKTCFRGNVCQVEGAGKKELLVGNKVLDQVIQSDLLIP